MPNSHLQTLWGKFFRPGRLHNTRIERLETDDGDFIDLYHLDGPRGAPILLILHGLEGSARSHYIQGLFAEASRRGWHATVMIFRSCGNELNRGRRFYHSGETSDPAFVLDHLQASFPNTPILVTGVSLGGNVLLKYLGERAGSVSSQIKGAAAVSVPYDLARSSEHIDRGFARLYQWNFLRSLRSKAFAKRAQFPDLVQPGVLERADTMFAFDDCFTAPVHGFRDAADYYNRSSAIKWIDKISVNTLLLSAVDDPFLPSQVLDEVRTIARRNPFLEIDFPAHGGHVGFVGGRNPLAPRYYLEQRVTGFLSQQL